MCPMQDLAPRFPTDSRASKVHGKHIPASAAAAATALAAHATVSTSAPTTFDGIPQPLLPLL